MLQNISFFSLLATSGKNYFAKISSRFQQVVSKRAVCVFYLIYINRLQHMLLINVMYFLMCFDVV